MVDSSGVATGRRLGTPAQLYLLHTALATFGLAIWGLFFNLAILAYGYDRAVLGWLNTAGMLAAAALAGPLWWLLTRIGLRRSLLLQAGLYAASALLFALRPGLPLLVLAVALSGAAAVLLELSALPFMMRYSTTETRDRIFSARSAIAIIVGGVGTLVGGSLPGFFGGALGVPGESAAAYQATFAVAAAVIALSLAPLAPLLFAPRPTIAGPPAAPTPKARAAPPAAPWWRPGGWLARLPAPWPDVVRRPWPVLRLLLTPFLISWGAALLIPYLNLFFKERFGVSDAALGVVLAAVGLATGLATLAAPRLSRRLGAMRAVVLAQALSLPFLLALGFVPVLWVAVAAGVLRGALFNMGWPLYQSFAMAETDERLRPAMAGLLGGSESLAYIVMPPLSVWLQARYGFGPIFVITGVCYAIATLVNFGLFVRRR